MLPALLATLLLPLESLGPGFILLRRLRLRPAERFALSVGLSLFLLYLATFLAYLVQATRAVNIMISLAAVGSLIPFRRQVRALFRDSEVKEMAGGYALLALWTLGLQALIRSYSGAQWAGDWFEHFHRTVYWSQHLPLDTRFLGKYLLPARPPMQNVLCASVLSVTGVAFEPFQVAMTLLNLTPWFPAWLLARSWSKDGGPSVLVLLAFMAFSPVVVESSTYTWTKLFAAAYALLGLYFYRSGIAPVRDPARLVAAFASLACGILVHYSTAPYALFLGAHYTLAISWRGPESPGRKLREYALVVAGAGLILLPWLFWAWSTFGREGLVGATSTSMELAKLPTLADKLGAFWENLKATLIPHPLRPSTRPFNAFPVRAGAPFLREWAFLIYQKNLVGGLGAGAPLILWEMARRFRAADREGRVFWAGFLSVVVLLGAVVALPENPWGQAHICLQPLVVAGAVLAAASWESWPRWAKGLSLAGLSLDLVVGVALNIWQQEFVPRVVQVSPGQLGLDRSEGLNPQLYTNYLMKLSARVTFLGDDLAGAAPLLHLFLGGVAVALLIKLAVGVFPRPGVASLPKPV